MAPKMDLTRFRVNVLRCGKPMVFCFGKRGAFFYVHGRIFPHRSVNVDSWFFHSKCNVSNGNPFWMEFDQKKEKKTSKFPFKLPFPMDFPRKIPDFPGKSPEFIASRRDFVGNSLDDQTPLAPLIKRSAWEALGSRRFTADFMGWTSPWFGGKIL